MSEIETRFGEVVEANKGNLTTNENTILDNIITKIKDKIKRFFPSRPETEHIQSITQSAFTEMLPRPKDDLSQNDNTQPEIFAFAHSCCNKLKTNQEFISFDYDQDNDTGMWVINYKEIENFYKSLYGATGPNGTNWYWSCYKKYVTDPSTYNRENAKTKLVEKLQILIDKLNKNSKKLQQQKDRALFKRMLYKLIQGCKDGDGGDSGGDSGDDSGGGGDSGGALPITFTARVSDSDVDRLMTHVNQAMNKKPPISSEEATRALLKFGDLDSAINHYEDIMYSRMPTRDSDLKTPTRPSSTQDSTPPESSDSTPPQSQDSTPPESPDSTPPESQDSTPQLVPRTLLLPELDTNFITTETEKIEYTINANIEIFIYELEKEQNIEVDDKLYNLLYFLLADPKVTEYITFGSNNPPKMRSSMEMGFPYQKISEMRRSKRDLSPPPDSSPRSKRNRDQRTTVKLGDFDIISSNEDCENLLLFLEERLYYLQKSNDIIDELRGKYSDVNPYYIFWNIVNLRPSEWMQSPDKNLFRKTAAGTVSVPQTDLTYDSWSDILERKDYSRLFNGFFLQN